MFGTSENVSICLCDINVPFLVENLSLKSTCTVLKLNSSLKTLNWWFQILLPLEITVRRYLQPKVWSFHCCFFMNYCYTAIINLQIYLNYLDTSVHVRTTFIHSWSPNLKFAFVCSLLCRNVCSYLQWSFNWTWRKTTAKCFNKNCFWISINRASQFVVDRKFNAKGLHTQKSAACHGSMSRRWETTISNVPFHEQRKFEIVPEEIKVTRRGLKGEVAIVLASVRLNSTIKILLSSTCWSIWQHRVINN